MAATAKSSTEYAAFLRGINVGGNKKVSMAALAKAFTTLGCGNVKTLLNSGNVVFRSSKSESEITAALQKHLEKTFGFTIGVLVRPLHDLQKLAKANPFNGIPVTPQTRLYVTFLSEPSTSSLKIPYASDDGNFRILSATPREVVSVLIVTPDRGTVDLMGIIEKEFGKKVTTRNWNTIERVLKAHQAS